MCRLLGIVCDEDVAFNLILREAPKSLSVLSKEHPHGWGIAAFSRGRWSLEKAPMCAEVDQRFHERAVQSNGVVLVAHVRQRTVGSLSHDNTHPFLRGEWVFCHNGTINDQDFLRDNTSERRRAERAGETDSELLLGYLLSAIDASADVHVADAAFDAALLGATERLTARRDFGACNYLLSNGHTLFAHRFGRTLYLLERTPRRALLVASEAMTDEPWQALEERTLVRFDRDPSPSFRYLSMLKTCTAA